MTILVGKKLKNRYRIEEFLGRGGMAEVYKVWDTQRGVPLAMKVLREDLAEDIVFMRRFEREAVNLTRLQHPNIVRCYGLEREGRTAYMLMDYIDGWTLRSEIFDAHGPLSMPRILEVIQPVCSALSYAHQMGMVHCDVKSANIMIHKNGTVYLTDFGIARGMDAATSTMVGVGTPAYMAPELIKGEDPTPQTDIYALGIVLYEMLTGGERPFTGERATITGTTAEKIRWEHLQLQPIPLRYFNPTVNSEMDQIFLRCIQKDPHDRFQSINDLFRALHAATANAKPVKAHRPVQTGIPHIPGNVPSSSASKAVSSIPSREQSVPANAGAAGERGSKGIIAAVVLFLGIILFVALNGAEKESRGTVSLSNAPNSSTRAVQSDTLDTFPTHAPQVTAMPVTIGSLITSPKDNMVMVYVPAGEFEMGSSDQDTSADEDEKPQHTVYLDAFWIDQTEVTNAMYRECVQEGVCYAPKKYSHDDNTGSRHFDEEDEINTAYDDYPVIYVDYEDATIYCEWAGKRLPTEAEWEKAARGTTGYRYPWGNQTPTSSQANFGNNIGDTVRVGNYPSGASMYGALDMVGNVYEWVSDLYSEEYYKDSPLNNPLGPSYGDVHVLRGGSFFADAKYCRSTYRSKPLTIKQEAYASGNWGFRCVISEVVER
ncbi:MAG TPA: hypothetical protein DCK95_02395 [Anaerolineaceae bacterium]|nr:hypothetical protein [Anaerolineaceae bacterium]